MSLTCDTKVVIVMNFVQLIIINFRNDHRKDVLRGHLDSEVIKRFGSKG